MGRILAAVTLRAAGRVQSAWYPREMVDDRTIPILGKRRQAITAGLLLGMSLGALEATVVGTAMPTIVATLGGLAHYSWVFSAYLVTSTVTVPVWGKLSDLYGRRLLYQIGIGIFLLGTLLSGLSYLIAGLSR